jgi:hypothetical protein
MRKLLIAWLFFFLLQNNIVFSQGKVGINTDTPQAMLHVKDSSILFSGLSSLPSPGNPPASGIGTRMMWYPDKAAFRSGGVSTTYWDKDSIGTYSFAAGFDVKAKGSRSASLGSGTTANGFSSLALGSGTVANGYASLVIGRFNHTMVLPQTNIVDTTPLFIVGNGSSSNFLSNAFVILNNGRIGIGMDDESPKSALDINGGIGFRHSVINITTSSNLVFLGGGRSYLQVTSNGVPTSKELFISPGSPGQLLIIQCTATGSNGFRIRNSPPFGAPMYISGAVFDMRHNDVITLIWDGIEWVEVNRSVK